MKKGLIIFLGVMFWTFTAAADRCEQRGFNIAGTENIRDLPIGYTKSECRSCREDGIYFWKCKEKAEAKAKVNKGKNESQVNCMDYLRSGDANGFAKCTGLQGKWEMNGNQVYRVE
jgi:hypothetical protein